MSASDSPSMAKTAVEFGLKPEEYDLITVTLYEITPRP